MRDFDLEAPRVQRLGSRSQRPFRLCYLAPENVLFEFLDLQPSISLYVRKPKPL